MELPRWVNDPHTFLRFLVPGMLFIAYGAAFFPNQLGNAMRTVVPNNNRADMGLILWFLWAVALGLVYNMWWRFLHALIRPRPHPATVVGDVLERAGAPPLSAVERRAVYALLDSRLSEDPERQRVARERALVEYSYEASTITALVGAFIAVWHPTGPLISPTSWVIQGVAMAAGGLMLAGWTRVREAVVHRMELATVRWADPETLAFLMQSHANVWAVSGPHGAPPAPAAPPPAKP